MGLNLKNKKKKFRSKRERNCKAYTWKRNAYKDFDINVFE